MLPVYGYIYAWPSVSRCKGNINLKIARLLNCLYYRGGYMILERRRGRGTVQY